MYLLVKFGIICCVVVSIVGQQMEVNKNFPSIDKLGSFGKNELLYLKDPKEIIRHIYHFCTQTVQWNDTTLPDYKDLSLTLYDGKENASFPLLNMENLIRHPSFNRSYKVIILITGWLSNFWEDVYPNAAADEIYRAYKCRGSTNFLVMDTSKQINNLYTSSAISTLHVGQYLANALRDLEQTVNINQIHLIGHSLGAHVAGAAGRFFKELTGKKLRRITGLDPGRVCFIETNGQFDLERGDAEFVDILHTDDSNSLGKLEPIGDLNFYATFSTIPCDNAFCSHKMSWRYYAESVYPGNEMGFLAKKCSSNNLLQISVEMCLGPTTPMGYATSTTSRGNYILDVNPYAPYGKNSKKDNRCNQDTKETTFLDSFLMTQVNDESNNDRPIWN